MTTPKCDPNYTLGDDGACYWTCTDAYTQTNVPTTEEENVISSCVLDSVPDACTEYGGIVTYISTFAGTIPPGTITCLKSTPATVGVKTDDECAEGYIENPFTTGAPNACVQPCAADNYMGVLNNITVCIPNCPDSMIKTDNGCVVQAFARNAVPVGVVVPPVQDGHNDNNNNNSNNGVLWAIFGLTLVLLVVILVGGSVGLARQNK